MEPDGTVEIGIMQTITSLSASAVAREDLRDILTDYVALDRARISRRLLVARFGALAVVAFLAGLFFNHPSWLLAVAMVTCLAPPAWAWVAEQRLAQRLARRLSQVDGVKEE